MRSRSSVGSIQVILLFCRLQHGKTSQAGTGDTSYRWQDPENQAHEVVITAPNRLDESTTGTYKTFDLGSEVRSGQIEDLNIQDRGYEMYDVSGKIIIVPLDAYLMH